MTGYPVFAVGEDCCSHGEYMFTTMPLKRLSVRRCRIR